jgi:hypothetical protein
MRLFFFFIIIYISTHNIVPLGVPALDLQTHAQSTTKYVSRTITGAGAGNYVKQDNSSFTIYGLSLTSLGGNGTYAYITWNFPTNNIFI